MKFATLALSVFFALTTASLSHAAELNIYTTREAALIEPLLAAYTKASSTKINIVFMKDGLAERIAAEGDSSPADILMAVDAGNLIDLVDKGLTQPVDSAALKSAIPAPLRGANDQWFGLSWRARVVYAATDLAVDSLTYEELADPKWQGQICIRAGQHPYNTALIAAHIAHHDTATTEKWLTGLKANLARKPGGGDRDVAKDILGGICKLGIANSYYVGLMRSGKGGPEQTAWGEGIKVILPTFSGGGTHVNISGAAVAKAAPNRDEAIKFLEFLVTDEAQKLYAEANFEYPVKAGVPLNSIIASFGPLQIDTLALADIVKNRKTASQLVDQTGFDN